MPAPKPTAIATAKARLEYAIFVTIVSLLRVLPFRQRSAMMAWIMSRVIAPLAGYTKRVHQNLDLIWPDMPREEHNALVTSVTRHIGRTICERGGRGFSDQLLRWIA